MVEGSGAARATDRSGAADSGPSVTPPLRSGAPPPRSGEDFDERPDELLVFDYIYGVLHSPDYRRTYAQFLKIDFPRIPYPANPEVFAHVAEKGGQLRRLHLMEDAAIGATPYPFKGAREDGDDNVVVKPSFSPSPHVGEDQGGGRVASAAQKSQTLNDAATIQSAADASGPHPNSPHKGERTAGRVHINPDQYFDAVPLTAWEFHIGGYQPAQKWLKDRKGRALSFEDVMHYQKIIKILCETDRIMKEIELPL